MTLYDPKYVYTEACLHVTRDHEIPRRDRDKSGTWRADVKLILTFLDRQP